MSKFEPYLELIASYVRQRTAQRILSTAHAVDAIRTGSGAGSDIVLKRDTFVELGNPTTASCAIALYTNDPSRVQDGQITLIGPDIPELSTPTVPFGQVLIAGGRFLTEDDYESLLEAQYVSDMVEGYMVRSSSAHIWSRVSNDAASKGFNFATLGRAITQHVKAQIPHVEAVELIFVTQNKEDVDKLSRIGTEVDDVARGIRHSIWQQRGVEIFECTKGGHCGRCSDKEVCDKIRAMVGERNHNPECVHNE